MWTTGIICEDCTASSVTSLANCVEAPKCAKRPLKHKDFHAGKNFCDEALLYDAKYSKFLQKEHLYSPKDIWQCDKSGRQWYFDRYLASKKAEIDNDNKKDTEMYNISQASIVMPQDNTVANQRYHLQNRLSTMYRDHEKKLRGDFGLIDMKAPRTWKELLERIEAKQFIYDEEEEKENLDQFEDDFFCGEGPFMYIEWRDPSVKKDKAGYKAAMKLLDKAFNDVKDYIVILEPKDALTAVKSFENWTLASVAN